MGQVQRALERLARAEGAKVQLTGGFSKGIREAVAKGEKAVGFPPEIPVPSLAPAPPKP